METKKISDLKIGDKVFIYNRFNKSLDEVERITKTQIVLKRSQSKFRIINGSSVGGDSWSTTHIEYADDEAVQKFRKELYKKTLIKKIQQEDLKDKSVEDLEKICEILNIQKEG